MNLPIESAIVVLVPEAEPFLHRFRRQQNVLNEANVPAHVTVLYPFHSREELTDSEIHVLRETFSQFHRFVASFETVGAFPSILFLSPQPGEFFRRMTLAVTDKFPEMPPYGGLFRDTIPHLTVLELMDPDDLEGVKTALWQGLKESLPIRATISETVLIDNRSGSWQIRERFPFTNGDHGKGL